MSIGGAFADVTEADFDQLVDVHFKGVFFLTQALLGRCSTTAARSSTSRPA